MLSLDLSIIFFLSLLHPRAQGKAPFGSRVFCVYQNFSAGGMALLA
jgi:hypothetical protein